MYRHWKQDPKSVHVSWQAYFQGMDKGLPSSSAYTPPPGFIGAASGVPTPADGSPRMQVEGGGDVTDYLKVGRDRPIVQSSNLTRRFGSSAS
jgi:2-oxoglutarate dehydrogenase E1 component